MFTKFLGESNYKLLKASIEAGENCSVFGLNRGEKLAVTVDTAFLFYIVDSIDSVSTVYDALEDMGRRCALFCEPLDIFSSEFTSSDRVMKTVYKTIKGDIDTIIMTPEMVFQRVPSLDSLEIITLKKGDELNLTKLSSKLVSLGYNRVDMVTNVGDFCIRGDILDIYPILGEPTRVVCDFDSIESIKYYNAVTMLTTKEVGEIEVLRNNFYSLTTHDIENFFTKHSLKKDSFYYELCENNDMDYRKIALDSKLNGSIFDLVKDGLVVFDGAKAIYDKISNAIKVYSDKVKEMDKAWSKILSLSMPSISEVLSFHRGINLLAFHSITESNRLFKPTKVFSIRTLPSVNYVRKTPILAMDIRNYIKNGYTVLLCAGSKENAERLKEDLEREGVNIALVDRMSQALKGNVTVVPRMYPIDVLLPEDKLALISTNNLYGVKKKIIEEKTSFFDGETPKNGDFIVHNFHGVGKCLGVETLKLSGGYRDYVIIEYKNNDKLYLPVENLDQVSKYVGGEESPKLNKIGGVEFAKTKSKVKSAVKKIAFDLIALYKDRMKLKGYEYPIDTDMQGDFERSFEFRETEDQLSAISDCKSDMESGKVMDRLVCGDVGFGKTEVALRIAFKTILSGKQVAFLCPTTILSEQHYNTAMSRMSSFGVKIEVLNRLKTPKQVAEIKKGISEGKIDMICGTHKLLASDINYKNLGLLILDEEQKFGVADKEKIKNLKKQVNVLTLSATPIPRTLNMALIGVRDISIISTPPTERQSSIVRVVEYDDILIKEAINRELSRGGQVLIVYNRIDRIYNFAGSIRNLAPEAKVSVAHGQMSAEELEKEIFNLYSGKTQVLVATTLIENGVDLPNANTLIVVSAENLGLSQLYQLKGRIGRSDKLSFAYFTYDRQKNLTETAYKRLQAIEEFSEMGSGFKIAMRDLEIRGAGSLLGLEQSGHIEKIGYNMYVSILNDSIKELSGEEVKERSEVRVETNISARLSQNYVASVNRRMSMYREIALIDNLTKFTDFIAKTEEVYGDVPDELISLCKISLIKNMASVIGVSRVVIKSTAKLILEDRKYLTKGMLETNALYPDNINLDISGEITLEFTKIDRNEILDFIINYLQILTNC